MNTEFEPTERWIAFEAFDEAALLDAYGVDLPGGRAVLAHFDDTERTRIRGERYNVTVTPTMLTDERICLRCLWPRALVAAIINGDIEAEELSDEQFAALTPPQPESEI